MPITRPKQNRFQMSYYKEEVPVFLPMEERLMKVYGIPTRSGIHKFALKKLDSITKVSGAI